MILVATFFLVLTASAYSSPLEAKANCTTCSPPKYIDHYLAKGCSPVTKPECPNCVQRYECPAADVPSDPNKCYYGGKTYDVAQVIQEIGPCQQCTCHKPSDDHKPTIICLSIECPEQLSGPEVLLQYVNTTIDDPQKCYLTYRPNECCGKLRCPRSNQVANPPATCTIAGKVYKEEERMYLSDCYACSCTSNFDPSNVVGNPSCHKESCYMDMDMLRRGCAPVYIPDGCCAIQYHCPHPSREERQRHCQTPPPEGHCKENPAQKFRFHSQSNKCQAFTYTGCGADYNVFDDERACMTYCTQADPQRDAPQTGKCYFGGANYEVGSVLQTEPQYTCTCSIPPEFTCLMRT